MSIQSVRQHCYSIAEMTSPPQVHKATAFHCIGRIRHQRPQRRCIDGLLHLFHLESRLLLSRVCFIDVHPCSVTKISRCVRAKSRGGDIDEHDIDDNVAFLSSANSLTCTEMSTGRPGNSITNFTVLPPGVYIQSHRSIDIADPCQRPDRGSFPLDHEGDASVT